MMLSLPGRIVSSYSSHGVVELEHGDIERVQYRRSVGRPVCGDQVTLQRRSQTLVLTRILPRLNAFDRADQHGRRRTVAANLDQVIIVAAPYPEPSPDIIDRYLVAVHSLAIKPVLLINKADLTGQDQHRQTSRRLKRQMAYLSNLGYPVITTSTKGEPGVGPLAEHLRHVCSILVGQSGVGKSSLVNALIPDKNLQTRAVSAATGKGTHTTTSTTGFQLPGGGTLIDSPGVWEYGLWPMPVSELQAGFKDIAELAEACQFNDCRHLKEPSCKVRAAVDAGTLPERRYSAYCRTVLQYGG